jgi:ribosomal protein S18 acetylase RimI-like enzyme
LYVDPQCRGGGAGRALIEGVCDAARANGSDRVYWLTQQSNTRAMALYDQVAVKTGFLQYRRML